jgi:hypothetical protein
MSEQPEIELGALRAAVAKADDLAASPSAFVSQLAAAGCWPQGPTVYRSPAGMWLARQLGLRAVVVGVTRVIAFDTWGHETGVPTPVTLKEFDAACRRGQYDHLAAGIITALSENEPA